MSRGVGFTPTCLRCSGEIELPTALRRLPSVRSFHFRPGPTNVTGLALPARGASRRQELREVPFLPRAPRLQSAPVTDDPIETSRDIGT